MFSLQHGGGRRRQEESTPAADSHCPHGGTARDWIDCYRRVRKQTEVLCRPLQIEDFNLQALPETSPAKWHLAHTTWFFEALLLREFCSGYRDYHPRYGELFNSYYQSLGQPFPREQRGLLSRPTLDEVVAYRHAIDERVRDFLRAMPAAQERAVFARLELGLHHEQQHQELLLTDIKYNFSVNPLRPAYMVEPEDETHPHASTGRIGWCEFPGGIVSIGADGAGFRFDNETPYHRVFLQPYALADRLVNNGDFLNFIDDGGYRRPEFWLSDGWTRVQQQGWQAPLYWEKKGGHWQVFTLYGMQPLQACEPVCHVSFFEADAFARWADARLPTEVEWENAARLQRLEGHFIDDGVLRPRAPCASVADSHSGPRQLFGDAWEWMASAYSPYPGYRAEGGAIGEYNGKFMCSQMVLRGGSCISPREHLRASYRNFFYPWDRWQFSGVRLARASAVPVIEENHA